MTQKPDLDKGAHIKRIEARWLQEGYWFLDEANELCRVEWINFDYIDAEPSFDVRDNRERMHLYVEALTIGMDDGFCLSYGPSDSVLVVTDIGE